jgi:hypothetical protein
MVFTNFKLSLLAISHQTSFQVGLENNAFVLDPTASPSRDKISNILFINSRMRAIPPIIHTSTLQTSSSKLAQPQYPTTTTPSLTMCQMIFTVYTGCGHSGGKTRYIYCWNRWASLNCRTWTCTLERLPGRCLQCYIREDGDRGFVCTCGRH